MAKEIETALNKFRALEQECSESAHSADIIEPCSKEFKDKLSKAEVILGKYGVAVKLYFKNETQKIFSIDYSLGAEPGDRLMISSLAWKTREGSDFVCLTGKLRKA